MSQRLVRRITAVMTVAAIAVWILLEPLVWPTRALATFLLVPLPVLLLVQARVVDQIPEDVERESIYLSSAVSIWVLAALAMLAARFGDLSREDLRLTTIPLDTLALSTGLTVAAGLLVLASGRWLRLRESELLHYLIPRTSSERIAFVGLSISAGIAEELVFRSFLIGTLLIASGSVGVAVAVSVAAFAVSHAYQGWTGAARVAVLGLILTTPFLVTGSVYPSMLAHALLDILAGIVLADWLRAGGRQD